MIIASVVVPPTVLPLLALLGKIIASIDVPPTALPLLAFFGMIIASIGHLESHPLFFALLSLAWS